MSGTIAELRGFNALNMEPGVPAIDIRRAEDMNALSMRFAQTLEDWKAKKKTNERRTVQNLDDEMLMAVSAYLEDGREDETADGEGCTDQDLEDGREELRAFEAECAAEGRRC